MELYKQSGGWRYEPSYSDEKRNDTSTKAIFMGISEIKDPEVRVLFIDKIFGNYVSRTNDGSVCVPTGNNRIAEDDSGELCDVGGEVDEHQEG